MNLNNRHNIYFIGIGGIGMSALARYFHKNKKQVAGYDKTQTEITDGLIDLGIHIHFEDSIANVEIPYLNPETTLIVYTPAIPKDQMELVYFRNKGFDVLKRSQVLGIITALASLTGRVTRVLGRNSSLLLLL